MSALFQIAGGNLSAQDEEAAAALKNAASAPPSINGPSMAIAGLSSISAFDAESSRADNFSWVAGEDATGMSLDEMKSGAESLFPGNLRSTAEQFSTASQTLSSAADQLLASVNSELGSSWQGEFANTALANVAQFHGSATELAGQLTTVAERASSLAEGYEFTRERVGGITPDSGAERDSDAAASREAARQDAQRVIHSDYNPRLESANLSGLTFTPAHRVGSAGSGTEGVSPVSLWNREIASPEGGTGGGPRTGVDSATQAASSSAGGAGAPAPTGGGGSPSSSGSPATATSATSGNTASGVMPAGVGAAPNGRSRPAGATASGPARSSAAATTPAATGANVANGRTSSSSPGTRTVSGTSSSAPIGARGLTGGGSSAGSGASAGARPLSATAGGGSTRSGLPFTSGGSASGGPSAAGGVPRAGAGPSVGTGLTAGSGAPGTSSGSAGSAAGSRLGGPMMGAMPMGAGGRSGDKSHSPADYLVHPSHSSELIGDLPAAVQPVLRGSRTTAE